LRRSAFTLFEMIIVVALIGIIYSIVLSNFNTKKSVTIYTLKDLRKSLMPFWHKGRKVQLVIYNECQKAALLINDEVNNSYKPKIKLERFKDIEAYKVDETEQLKKIEFPPVVIDDKVHNTCFNFSIFRNGANSNFIVKQDERYYIFYPYFEDVNESEDESEAIDMFTHKEYRGVDIHEVQE